MKIPHQDGETKGGVKRTYWTADMAQQGRRIVRKQVEAECLKKNKRYSQADRAKAVDERWGEYCETQRSVDEGRALIAGHPGIDANEHNFAHRKR